MPSLIDLKTDLKSLRYGNDTLGGGNSGQPYIQTSIPDGFNDLGANEDFILRGGISAAKDSITDIKRLGKMFTDLKSPSGLIFIAKQQLLSRTAVRTQTSGVLNEGIYSPLNTLAQAGLVAFGNHLNKQGINPFAQTGAYANNDALYNTKVKSTQPKSENRLVNLYEVTSTTPQNPRPYGEGVTLNNGINVMTYTGGPGSILGAGNTAIRYSTLSKTDLTNQDKTNTFSVGNWVFNSKDLVTPFESQTLPPVIETFQSPDRQGSVSSPKIQDFRKILREKLGTNTTEGKNATNSGATTLSQDYIINGGTNISQRVNIGDPGQRGGKSYADYSKGVMIGNDSAGPLDKINALPIYRSQNVDTTQPVNDLVKFRIAVIDNDSPNFKTFMHFRAFLGPISDSYNAQWNGFSYLGRGEQFYTYGGFNRSISLSWTVAAQSKQELIPMYKKLNYLASSLAPDYSPNGYMRGNLVQLTIGGYLYEQPGFITGLTYEMGEESPWEIGIGVTNGSEDGTVKELTQIIKVTGFNFTPIHNFIPRKQQLRFSTNATETTGDDTGFVSSYLGDQRFIALANGPGKEDNNYAKYDTSL